MQASSNFKLYGGDDAFANRQKKLFDQLSIAEKECNKGRNITETSSRIPMDVESLNPDMAGGRCPPQNGRKRKSEMRQFRGKESIFKRPEGPAPRNNSHSIPDHHRNPHKWMKYSLDDVSTDDMTDRSNARTAFAFLNELKARRAKETLGNAEDSDFPMESGEKCENTCLKEPRHCTSIRFKKPRASGSSNRQNSAVIDKPEEKPMFLSTKILMPEYVVGQKQKKKKDNKEKRVTSTSKVDRVKELKLNHLEEFEDEDDGII